MHVYIVIEVVIILSRVKKTCLLINAAHRVIFYVFP